MAKKNITEKKSILYFDDEPFITSALARSLEFFGWDVTLVDEIDGLFKELITRQFDILILDIKAPIPNKDNKFIIFSQKEIDEMDEGSNTGVVLVKRIWTMYKYQDIPILFLSAKRNPISDNPELKKHKCGYLRKPELARTVSQMLENLLNK